MAVRSRTNSMQTQSSLTPIPDPTVLTTQQLQREITTSREVVETRMDGIKALIETRIFGMDRAIELQFTELDKRNDQTKADSTKAVDAALQAAKEAVGAQNIANSAAMEKSAATFTKQIEQLGVAMTTMTKTLDDKFNDAKDRMQTIESRIQGIESMKKGAGDLWGILAAAIGIIVGISGTIFAGIAMLSKTHQ